jgi:hypothetical protein
MSAAPLSKLTAVARLLALEFWMSINARWDTRTCEAPWASRRTPPPARLSTLAALAPVKQVRALSDGLPSTT